MSTFSFALERIHRIKESKVKRRTSLPENYVQLSWLIFFGF
jgi:hypothetical protein